MKTAVRDKSNRSSTDEIKSLDQRLQQLQPTGVQLKSLAQPQNAVPVPDWLNLERLARNVPQELLIARVSPPPPPKQQFCSGTNPQAPTVAIRPRPVLPEAPKGKLRTRAQPHQQRRRRQQPKAVDYDDDDDDSHGNDVGDD